MNFSFFSLKISNKGRKIYFKIIIFIYFLPKRVVRFPPNPPLSHGVSTRSVDRQHLKVTSRLINLMVALSLLEQLTTRVLMVGSGLNFSTPDMIWQTSKLTLDINPQSDQPVTFPKKRASFTYITNGSYDFSFLYLSTYYFIASNNHGTNPWFGTLV